MQRNVAEVAEKGGAVTIGLTVYPPYPKLTKNTMDAYTYQNGGDWTWYARTLVLVLVNVAFIVIV